MEALFTSLVGGDALRRRVLELIAEATALANSSKIDLHVMMFAFTDQEVANVLAEAAAGHPSMTIRILADWSQRSHARGQQVGRLARLDLPNLRIRYKNDQPYVWDAAAGQVRWSYRVSRGLLHHKTLGVLVNGRPWRLICGSFNWTATAVRSYENLLILTPEQPESHQLMSRIELEFEALWSDSRATLSPQEAHLHYRAIIDQYRRQPTIPPAALVGLAQGREERLQILDPEGCPSEYESVCTDYRDDPLRFANPRVAIAFNSRRPEDASSQCGHAKSNRTQRFFLCTPSTKRKYVPLTLTNLALDTIFRAVPGETLKIAMYGLSTRVPEYGALLDAARRGVRLFVLLDGIVGFDVSSRLARASRLQALPIEVRITSRMMHQKYIVGPESATVLTGTANMSTDASSRHFEHRIRISGNTELCRQFCADFDTIWARLSANASVGNTIGAK
jgi:phosphatidylserine/phosphatidylglycerophosphate/cardiolipin synthase-like enzyme